MAARPKKKTPSISERARSAKTRAGKSLEILAIDFETADRGADSACAIGLARISGGKVIETTDFSIRPPRRSFEFTWVHGITWADVKDEPDFGELWPELKPYFRGIDLIAAHNASFDRSVLRACCEAHDLALPRKKYLCTVKLARAAWNVRPTKLPDVCRYLSISLNHHDAASDAHACAQIAAAAIEDKFDVTRAVL